MIHGNRLNNNRYYVIRTKAGKGGIKEIANLPDKEIDVEMDFKVTTSNHYYIQNKDTENIHLINAMLKKSHEKDIISKHWTILKRIKDYAMGYEDLSCILV